MDDSGIGRHHAEIAERRLAPAQQDVAFAIALELEGRIEIECIHAAEVIHLHRVIDYQIGRQQRIGAARVAAHGGQGVAHGGKVHHAGDAGEVLQQDARRHEADLFDAGAVTARHGDYVRRGNPLAVFIAQQILQKNPDGKRQSPDIADALLGEMREAEIIVFRRCRRAASPRRQSYFLPLV